MKSWITFDLDGTLMQNPFVGHVFPEIERLVLEKAGGNGTVLPEILTEHTSRISEGRHVEAYDWDDILTVYLAGRGIERKIDVEQLVCQFCNEPTIYLLEDCVLEVLEELRKRGYSLAAVTNGYLKYQKPVMDALQLTPLFDRIITPENVGYAKPDCRMFSKVEGDIIMHVGDRLEHDVRSANDAGIPSVFINRCLPETIKALPIRGRGSHSEMAPFLLAKLNRETKQSYRELPSWAVPSHVICSIRELVSSLP